VSLPPLGIGIIGLGRVSPAHVESYASLPREARVAAVCDTDEVALEAVASRLGVPGFRDYRQLLAHPGVDAVVILLPHLLHHPAALAALQAGKHVTLEKPMAVTEAECENLIAVARDRGVVLSVSENSRFVESYLRVAQLIEERWTGGVRLVRAFIYGSALQELADPSETWKREPQGFAAILDAVAHFFYVFTWMFGQVASLQATARHWARDHGIPDCAAEDGAIVHGRFAAGGHFTIEVALNVELPWGERLEVYGDDGTVICDQLVNPPVVTYRSTVDYGTALPEVTADPRGWRAASIHRGAADFVRAVRYGRAPAVTAHDAAYAVRLVQAAYRSVRAGGVPVDVEQPGSAALSCNGT
jgi:predicted dehydrogenase